MKFFSAIMQWSYFGILNFFLSIGVLQAIKKIHDPDNNIREHVEDCLADNGLNISILGIDKIEDLNEKSFENLKDIAKDIRNCFVACVYKKKGIITPEGTLAEPVFRADPNKKFTTTFDDAINACRGEKNFCRLGGCLYGVYF
ncbi:uncharacterized protein LOC131667845 [Phymastichus coffea]|uniref:uncharacterized protein LOC131667845 n=1 Tax=Phymastichus coffea TaxID=108790 RepID=UPI00273CBC5D|nr:uncharacterized protein LOC131667845 [Phymastichus coffea]